MAMNARAIMGALYRGKEDSLYRKATYLAGDALAAKTGLGQNVARHAVALGARGLHAGGNALVFGGAANAMDNHGHHNAAMITRGLGVVNFLGSPMAAESSLQNIGAQYRALRSAGSRRVS